MAKPLLRQLDTMRDKIAVLESGGPSEPGGSAGVASFNGRTGAVTLGGADVTDALGFTPQEAGSFALTSHNHEGVYALAGHSHVIADVSGLQTALNGKQAAGNYQPAGSYAAASHTHVIADVTGLQTALDGKQAVGSYSLTSHNHSGVYAPVSHSHVIADVTGLQTALDGKQAAGSYAAASHTHTASQITDFSEAVDDRVGALLVQGSNITLSYNDAGNALTVTASGGGGVDPWTYVKLGNDFVTNSATAVDVTGMAFTPSANTSYEFEAHLMCRTATATVGPRPGLAWPTGGSDGVASIYTPSSGTAETMVHGNIAATLLAAVGGLPTTTGSYGAKVQGIFVAGASPSGTVKVQLASETAGTNVTIKAGSFLKYRTI